MREHGNKTRAALGSALFFACVPSLVAGVVPWWITGWSLSPTESGLGKVRVAVGLAVVLAGAAVLVRAFVRFVEEGRGTPAPVAPTDRLVVGGDYRYVRNPMYVAVVSIVVGQAMVFGSWPLLLYAAAIWLLMAGFVRFHEEPVLHRRFGSQYEDYRRSVRAWMPRRHAWTGSSTSVGDSASGQATRRT